MNKFVATQLLLLLGFVLASAQPRLRVPELYIGVHGGVNASTVIFDPTVDGMNPITKGCTLSPTAGVAFRYAGQKCCGLQLELNYHQRGWREELDEGAYVRRLHYVEVPFLMHLFFGKKSGKFIFNLGPQIGGCVYDDGGAGAPEGSSAKQYGAVEKPFYWGVAAGLGGYYRSAHAGLWQMELRANYSMGSLFDNSATAYFRNFSNPLELSINLAWMWPLTPKAKKQVKNKP